MTPQQHLTAQTKLADKLQTLIPGTPVLTAADTFTNFHEPAIGLAAGEDGGQVRGLANVDGKLAVEAELTFALMPISNARLIERRREVLQTWLSGSIGQ